MAIECDLWNGLGGAGVRGRRILVAATKSWSCIRMPSLRTYRPPLGLLLKFQRLVLLHASVCRPGCGMDSNVRIVGCEPWNFHFVPSMTASPECLPATTVPGVVDFLAACEDNK